MAKENPPDSITPELALGDIAGNRFLNGFTKPVPFGGVGLAPYADDTVFTGTHWQLSNITDDIYTIACAGSIDGPRYLNGNTHDGSVNLVGDTLAPFSGAMADPGIGWRSRISCVPGNLPQSNFFRSDGRTIDGTVGMAPHGGEPYSGALWATQLVANPTLMVNTRRELTASLIDIVGTNFRSVRPHTFCRRGNCRSS